MSEPITQWETIPIVQERATVETCEVETDRVRVRTIIEEELADVVARLSREDIVVERRPVERQVPTAPSPREDGDTLILSVVEERPVVEKRLFVTEEILIRRVARTDEVHIPTTLRTMRAVVEQRSIQTPESEKS